LRVQQSKKVPKIWKREAGHARSWVLGKWGTKNPEIKVTTKSESTCKGKQKISVLEVGGEEPRGT